MAGDAEIQKKTKKICQWRKQSDKEIAELEMEGIGGMPVIKCKYAVNT